MPGGSAVARAGSVARAREVDEPQRGAVADQEPAPVVLLGPVPGHEVLDGRVGTGVAGQGDGQVATGALGRVLGVAQGLVGQAGADSVLVDGEPGAARLLVAPAKHAGA